MTKTIKQRLNFTEDDNFVVLIIRTRIHHLWKLHSWVPSLIKILMNLKEFSYIDERGFLGYQILGYLPLTVVQYWNSVEQLEFHLKEQDNHSTTLWKSTVESVRNIGEFTIWHEIYDVKSGKVDIKYSEKPIYDLQEYLSYKQLESEFVSSIS